MEKTITIVTKKANKISIYIKRQKMKYSVDTKPVNYTYKVKSTCMIIESTMCDIRVNTKIWTFH